MKAALYVAKCNRRLYLDDKYISADVRQVSDDTRKRLRRVAADARSAPEYRSDL
ncbi:hypothetical protein ABZT17_21615 [Streptomyces sp. NPDC005648]|uniref:hypothetical protein n=1 Tax=Streptomyces sp. NPDC005648 TaxID=3157044 RepID=UPI0033B725D9